MIKRVFLIVLDSVGAGYLPDAADYGDVGANTLATISKSKNFHVPNMRDMGYFNIEGVEPEGVCSPTGAYGRLAERSKGKDTTIGHWELAGIVSERPLPVFHEGFPPELVEQFERAAGVKVLCNKPYSGTDVIRDYGMEHIRTGRPILYTSADSVFQLAAHEKYFGLERLYEVCGTARGLLTGKWGVGRVIARPFVGETPETFKRTANRHDLSIDPPGKTLLDVVSGAGMDVVAVGKINDIFAGRGVTRSTRTFGNADGMAKTADLAREDFTGLCFVNLVDFDMLYGHRNDIDGYASALSEFDAWLSGFKAALLPGDALILTADHGCDPGFPGTDHSREYIPFLACGEGIRPVNIGTRSCFSDIACTAAELLGLDSGGLCGESFAGMIRR